MKKAMEKKSLSKPDETRTFEKGKLEVVKLEKGVIGRATFEPGWKWSTCVKPIAKTESCQTAHFGYIVSGRMKVVMDDGTDTEYGPGDAMSISPGTTRGSSATRAAWRSTSRAPSTTHRRNSGRPLGETSRRSPAGPPGSTRFCLGGSLSVSAAEIELVMDDGATVLKLARGARSK